MATTNTSLFETLIAGSASAMLGTGQFLIAAFGTQADLRPFQAIARMAGSAYLSPTQS